MSKTIAYGIPTCSKRKRKPEVQRRMVHVLRRHGNGTVQLRCPYCNRCHWIVFDPERDGDLWSENYWPRPCPTTGHLITAIVLIEKFPREGVPPCPQQDRFELCASTSIAAAS